MHSTRRSIAHCLPGKATGVRNASLSYSKKRYAKITVIQNELKLVGWPKDIPFRDFNSVRGGNASLRRLLRRWRKGKLRFERATPEDIEAAKRDPSAVLPGAAKRKAHPAHLEDTIQPASSNPSPAAALGDPQRRQRIDTKKPRGRDLTGPYVREHPLPKEGIKSKPYILDSDVEDDLGQPGAEDGDFWLVEEPIAALRLAATGSMFGFFSSSPYGSHGRPSGTVRLLGAGGNRMVSAAASASG